jgi:predicted DNA-binding transcriptional regulator AlpA
MLLTARYRFCSNVLRRHLPSRPSWRDFCFEAERRMEAMQADSDVTVERVRSKRQVCDILGISPSTLTRLEASGDFPARTQISVRRYGWRDSAIAQFIHARST